METVAIAVGVAHTGIVGGARAVIGIVVERIVVGTATAEEIEWVIPDAASRGSGRNAAGFIVGSVGRGRKRGGYRVGIGVEGVGHGDIDGCCKIGVKFKIPSVTMLFSGSIVVEGA